MKKLSFLLGVIKCKVYEWNPSKNSWSMELFNKNGASTSEVYQKYTAAEV